MKNILFIAFLCVSNFVLSQDTFLIAESSQTDQVFQIKENKRIRVITNEGKRYSGRWKEVSNDSIMVRFEKLAIADIDRIKRHPFIFMLIQGSAFILVGTIGSLTGIAIFAIGAPLIGVPITAASLALGYAGITEMNIFKGYETSDGFQYKLKTILNSSEN